MLKEQNPEGCPKHPPLLSLQRHALRGPLRNTLKYRKKNECVKEQNPEVTEALVQEAPEPLEGTSCSNCTVLQNTVRKLRNRIVSLENKAKKWKLSDRRSKYRIEGEYSVYHFVLFQLICENNEMCGKILPAPLFEIKY